MFIEFELDDGSTVIIEVADEGQTVEGGLVQASIGDKLLIRAKNSFDKALDGIPQVANTLLRKFKSLADAPDEIEVTFGLSAVGELGGNLVFAKVGAEANYTVKLKWKRPE